jgi:3-methyladenine DNA glycosylase AlkD
MPTAATSTSAQDILNELKPLGTDPYKKILLNHGAKEPFFGVKIEYLKKIHKRLKTDHQLALDLFDTGNYDAQYLAGLIADDRKMTKKDFQRWLTKANSPPIFGYTIAWVAAGSDHALPLALEWIDSKNQDIATAGWNTLAGLVASRDDKDLDLDQIKKLLDRATTTIHDQPDRARYAINSFIIAVGSYVKSLTAQAIAAAKKVGPVEVNMGNTACKVPDAAQYINKVKAKGALGKKRKSVKC